MLGISRQSSLLYTTSGFLFLFSPSGDCNMDFCCMWLLGAELEHLVLWFMDFLD